MPSTAIRSFEYDASRSELTVKFATGRGYVYSLVPPSVATALGAAASKGAFLNQHIRDRYPFRRIGSGATLTLREALRGKDVDEPGEDEPGAAIAVRRDAARGASGNAGSHGRA